VVRGKIHGPTLLKEQPLAAQPASRAALHARLIKLEKLLRTECFANEPVLHGRGHRKHCYWCEAAADAHEAAEALAPHRQPMRRLRKGGRRPAPLRSV
jgi:hypothetical protein